MLGELTTPRTDYEAMPTHTAEPHHREDNRGHKRQGDAFPTRPKSQVKPTETDNRSIGKPTTKEATTNNITKDEAKPKTFAMTNAMKEGTNKATRVMLQYHCPKMKAGCSWKSPKDNGVAAELTQEYVQWHW